MSICYLPLGSYYSLHPGGSLLLSLFLSISLSSLSPTPEPNPHPLTDAWQHPSWPRPVISSSNSISRSLLCLLPESGLHFVPKTGYGLHCFPAVMLADTEIHSYHRVWGIVYLIDFHEPSREKRKKRERSLKTIEYRIISSLVPRERICAFQAHRFRHNSALRLQRATASQMAGWNRTSWFGCWVWWWWYKAVRDGSVRISEYNYSHVA